jgi:hypothetical protein
MRVWEDHNGDTMIEVKITKGVKGAVNRARMTAGWIEDWCDSVVEDRSVLVSKIHKAIREGASPLIYGENLPSAMPRQLRQHDLTALVEGLQRR